MIYPGMCFSVPDIKFDPMRIFGDVWFVVCRLLPEISPLQLEYWVRHGSDVIHANKRKLLELLILAGSHLISKYFYGEKSVLFSGSLTIFQNHILDFYCNRIYAPNLRIRTAWTAVSVATANELESRGTGSIFLTKSGDFLFSSTSGPDLGNIQTPIRW